jgi:C-terminal processing protease CtpA/Prc
LIIRPARNDVAATLLEIDVVRDALKQPSVLSTIESDGGYSLGLVSVSVIGEQTDTLFAAEMNKLLDSNVDGLILDLRGNGG